MLGSCVGYCYLLIFPIQLACIKHNKLETLGRWPCIATRPTGGVLLRCLMLLWQAPPCTVVFCLSCRVSLSGQT